MPKDRKAQALKNQGTVPTLAERQRSVQPDISTELNSGMFETLYTGFAGFVPS